MYICLCNGLTDKQIKEVLHGATSVEDVYDRLNVCVSCGKCAETVLEMMDTIQEQYQKTIAS